MCRPPDLRVFPIWGKSGRCDINDVRDFEQDQNEKGRHAYVYIYILNDMEKA